MSNRQAGPATRSLSGADDSDWIRQAVAPLAAFAPHMEYAEMIRSLLEEGGSEASVGFYPSLHD